MNTIRLSKESILKHNEIIVAWAKGYVIECQMNCGAKNWNVIETPQFDLGSNYRIKPF